MAAHGDASWGHQASQQKPMNRCMLCVKNAFTGALLKLCQHID